jgi:hypothetical protein
MSEVKVPVTHETGDVRAFVDLKQGDEVYYRPLFGRDVPATVTKVGKRVSIRVLRRDVGDTQRPGEDDTKVIAVGRSNVRPR